MPLLWYPHSTGILGTLKNNLKQGFNGIKGWTISAKSHPGNPLISLNPGSQTIMPGIFAP
jgi:hypothetical protein